MKRCRFDARYLKFTGDISRHFIDNRVLGFGKTQRIYNILLRDRFLHTVFQRFFITDFCLKPV